MDKDKTKQVIDQHWDNWFVPGLSDFVRVPNLSHEYDPEYFTNGLLEKAIDLVHSYVEKLEIKGVKRTIIQHPKSQVKMVIYVVDPSSPDVKGNVMLYGHLDKQPHGEGWDEGLSATNPVIKGDLLYGRGSTDDGYASFMAMLAIKNAQIQGAKMPRICLVLETEEESGSESLVDLLKQGAEITGVPDYMFCLDSGCIDYNQLWMTSSLRGVAMLDIEISCGSGGFHSGECGGIVPETFRILRTLLDRLDDPKTGKVSQDFQPEVPEWKEKEAEYLTKLCGMELCTKFPLHEGCKWSIHEGGLKEMYLENVWRPNLSITGIGSMPKLEIAGNVVRPKTAVRLSMRTCPQQDPEEIGKLMEQKLTTDVPYNAQVKILQKNCGPGWCMKELEKEINDTITKAGADFFDGKPTALYGEGGSIPFLKELGDLYPNTQIIALGVGGPNSNSHAPNEMIHLPYTKKMTCSLSHILHGCTK